MSYNSNKKIEDLDIETTIPDTDYVPFGDTSDSGRAKAITFANFKAEIVGDDTAFVRKSLYDANTVLYATTDNTPLALTVGEQTIVGRATGGAISALAIDSDLSSVSSNDDTVPSAKATKTALDLKANDNAVVKLTGDQTVAGIKTFSSDPLIPDEAYGSGWNGVLEPPTKNAVYDKIEAVVATIPSISPDVVTIPRPLMPYSGVGTRSLGNNVDGYIHMFSLDRQITVNKITFNVTAVGTSGTINIGIFSADGQTRHISVTTGTISGTGLVTTSVSAVSLPAGNYYMLLGSVSTADVTFTQWSAASPASNLRAVSSEPTLCGGYTVTASTMPSTITLASISSGPDGAFTFRLDN